MSSSAEVAKRRQAVGDLWVRGVPVHRIASTLKTPDRTIRSDVEVIRAQLQQDRIAELEARRDRSVAVLRKVQQEAWGLFARLEDASSSKVGALNTVVSTEEKIAKLEGTLGADVNVNQTTNVNVVTQEDWQRIQETIAAALMPFSDARIAVASALAQMDGTRDKLS